MWKNIYEDRRQKTGGGKGGRWFVKRERKDNYIGIRYPGKVCVCVPCLKKWRKGKGSLLFLLLKKHDDEARNSFVDMFSAQFKREQRFSQLFGKLPMSQTLHIL